MVIWLIGSYFDNRSGWHNEAQGLVYEKQAISKRKTFD